MHFPFYIQRFDSQHPGMVYYKGFADSAELQMQLLKDVTVLPPLELPEPLSPPGLPPQRIKYLHDKIRQFCAKDHRADNTCPMPEE